MVPVAHLETMDVERPLARMDALEQADWLEPYNLSCVLTVVAGLFRIYIWL